MGSFKAIFNLKKNTYGCKQRIVNDNIRYIRNLIVKKVKAVQYIQHPIKKIKEI